MSELHGQIGGTPATASAAEHTAAMPVDVAKHLASEGRAGTFPRRKARTLQRAYVRRHWRPLVLAYLLLVAGAGLPGLLLPTSFLRGLAVGLAVAGGLGAILNLVVVHSGTGPTMAGEHAEQWTVQELGPLLKLGYELVNHIDIDGSGDADHVLVGPAGVFVLETKWSSTAWTDGQADKFRWSLERHAHRTALQLRRHGAQHAEPVFVLWGQAAEPLIAGTGVRRSGSTTVVAGQHLARWVLSRAPGVLGEDQVRACHRALCDIAVRGDRLAPAVPLGVETMLNRSLVRCGAAVTAFILPLAVGIFHPAAPLVALPLLLGFRRLRGRYWPAGAAVVGAACALTTYVGVWLYAFCLWALSQAGWA